MRTALVFGASGQLGRPLLGRLRQAGWDVVAVSRVARDLPGARWVRGELPGFGGAPGALDAIFSCGPLDRFAEWLDVADTGAARIVAFGSTSLHTKRRSADDAERDVAQRLARAERRLFDTAARRGAGATVLQPTLLYGAGADRTLSRLAAAGRRWRIVPLPADATGRRQPVHVDDLAAAALSACDSPATHGRAYAVPGGEALPYLEMVERVLATVVPPARVLRVPGTAYRAALSVAHRVGLARALPAAVVARMREDLVFDATPARRDFGYAPRPFRPAPGMFGDA